MEKKRHALRKLMEAVEHELLKKPNRKTLDRLSMLAGFQDWDSFQETMRSKRQCMATLVVRPFMVVIIARRRAWTRKKRHPNK